MNTTISSIHRNHHWEGVGLYPAEVDLYHSRDPRARKELLNKAIKRVGPHGSPESDPDSQEKIDFICANVIKVVTILQGK